MKISRKVLELFRGRGFLTKFSREHNSVKNVDGVTVLNLCISFDDDLYLYQVSRKYLKRFQSYRYDFPTKLFKGA